MKKIIALMAFLSIGCGHRSSKTDSLLPKPSRFIEIEDRATAMTSPPGWVACVNTDGSPGCLGDSLIFTGIAMGSADCEHAQVYADALIALNGKLVRHPTNPGLSLDGQLGYMWGFDKMATRCPDQKAALAAAFKATTFNLDPFFGTMRDQVAADLGLQDPPSESDRGHLGAEVAAWASAVVADKAAAYRLHLGYLVLSVVSAPNSTSIYCDTVKDAEIPLLEGFCGRPGLEDWLNSFTPDVWEYRHQRAVWEDPDGNGRQTAGIDYLVGYRQAFP